VGISGAQNLQVHYDFRHFVDPNLQKVNFPSFTFEYFKQIDTASRGSFLFKLQADLNARRNNVGQTFMQISQSLRFWQPKVFLSVNYSGGLGLSGDSFGYTIFNSFGAGATYPFQWKGAWISLSLLARYNAFAKPSYDPQFTLYFGRGIRNYQVFIAGSFVFWTQNRNVGIESTMHERGKKFSFFGDPQIWIRLKNNLSAGSRINVFYHIYTIADRIQLYPTVGLKYQF
jgi:hypothetical protein